MLISISSLKLFKACRRAYQLRYIEELVPVNVAEPLVIGTNYHAKIERLYKEHELDETDFSRETAMAMAYKKYVYPNIQNVLPEISFKMPIGDDDYFIGRVDGLNSDGKLVEHKSTSGEITEAYEYGLMWDDQIPAYMYATGAREMLYTVCRKPTVRQRKEESDEEFFKRMCEWYDDDTDAKIRVLNVYRTSDEVKSCMEHIRLMADEIKGTKNFYRNSAYCMSYGRRCEYAPVCLDYNPEQEYVGFKREERYGAKEDF